MAASLAGKVALVTGASSGIGEAAARCLARAGVAVGVSARRADRLEALVADIEAEGGRAVAISGDVADEKAAARMVADTVEAFERLDILVNAAGIINSGGVEGADLEAWRRVMDVNLFGTLYASRAAIPHLKAQGGGDIINISSTAGRRAAAIFGPYSASKFALNGMSEAMRQELGAAGIRVCIVEPGATATEVAGGIDNPDLRAAMESHVGAETAMSAEDIGDTVVFVASLPARANVSEILIRPTADTAPM